MKSSFKTVLVVLSSIFTIQASAAGAGLVGFSEVDRGLYRGSHPSSEDDYKQLKDAGIKTILSLQTSPAYVLPGQTKAADNGIKFINEPLFAFTPYISNGKMLHILELMQDESLKPIYVHCLYGRDRTGLAVGMYRVHVQNWTPENAYTEMRKFGFSPYLVFGLWAYFKTHSTPESLISRPTPAPESEEPTIQMLDINEI